MNYPLIKKFLTELKIHSSPLYLGNIISPSDLEAELARGVEVYGKEFTSNYIGTALGSCDTHSGLLIGYKPIESSKPVSREEIIKVLNIFSEVYIQNGEGLVAQKLLERIKTAGVKND